MIFIHRNWIDELSNLTARNRHEKRQFFNVFFMNIIYSLGHMYTLGFFYTSILFGCYAPLTHFDFISFNAINLSMKLLLIFPSRAVYPLPDIIYGANIQIHCLDIIKSFSVSTKQRNKKTERLYSISFFGFDIGTFPFPLQYNIVNTKIC